MEQPSKRQRISRIESRRLVRKDSVIGDDFDPVGFKEPPPAEATPTHSALQEPLLVKEMRGRRTMGAWHRLLHRRQEATESAASHATVTAVVSVVATVDENGAVISSEVYPAAVQATPSPTSPPSSPQVPTVPSVPPFPSDLTVPAVPTSMPSVPSYPFNTVPGTVSVTNATPSPNPTAASNLAVSAAGIQNSTSSVLSITAAAAPSSLLNSNSTSSSTTSLTSSLSSSITTTTESTIITSTQSATSKTTVYPQVSTSSTYWGGGGGTPYNPDASTGSSSNTNTASSAESDSARTAKVAGGVVGALAGTAALLILALVLIRWYKNKHRATQRLPEHDNETLGGPGPTISTPMVEQRSLLPASAGALFNRFSASSKSSSATAATSPAERGFQRISGRKLPSAFSEGMSSADFHPEIHTPTSSSYTNLADRNNTLSGSSFYRDSQGFWGGMGQEEARRPSPNRATASRGTEETLMPSPAKTPTVIHSATSNDRPVNPFVPPVPPRRGGALNPPRTPARSEHSSGGGTLGRSHPSHDGSRGSRFTEDV